MRGSKIVPVLLLKPSYCTINGLIPLAATIMMIKRIKEAEIIPAPLNINLVARSARFFFLILRVVM
jgi:hypothetical protein